MRYAIIDLGTNTFNLLVAEKGNNESINIVEEIKLPVKLGEGGITRKIITPEAWDRGISAIASHVNTAKQFNSEKIIAYATSATRNAANGADFVDQIFRQFGVKVNVIDGKSEAEFIYYGVRQAFELGEKTNLIMDIGGGSNELILANSKQIFWMQSFDLGVSRLLHTFHPSDPIKAEEIDKIESHFRKELMPFFNALNDFRPVSLVGSSGSFDTYRNMLAKKEIIPDTKNHSVEIPINEYFQLHQEFIKSTRDERLQMNGLEPMRVDFIVMASLFTYYILDKTGINKMYQSDFALKEGALWKLLYSSN